MKDELLRIYEKTTAATRTVFGFEYEKRVYMAILDAIPAQWVKLAKESSKRGGENKLRLEVNKTEKAKLLRKAVMVGTVEIINTIKSNKGDSWEKWVAEHYKQVWKKTQLLTTKMVTSRYVAKSFKSNGKTRHWQMKARYEKRRGWRKVIL